MKHELKIHHSWAERRRDNTKAAEVRVHDRDFQTGDLVTFQCRPDPVVDAASAQACQCMAGYEYVITHVLAKFVGLEPGYCLLSLHPKDGYGGWE